jgi:hypothetical protein
MSLDTGENLHESWAQPLSFGEDGCVVSGPGYWEAIRRENK